MNKKNINIIQYFLVFIVTFLICIGIDFLKKKFGADITVGLLKLLLALLGGINIGLISNYLNKK